MAEIRNLTRNGETFYPLTTISAVINEDTDEGMIIDEEPISNSNNLVKSGGIADKYGDWVYLNCPYIYVLVDKNGVIILAIKEDYSIYYGKGVPSQVQEQLDEKVNKIVGKGIIQSDFADSMDVDILAEFVFASIAADNSIIYGVKKNGTSYLNKIESPTIDEITGHNSNIHASSYVHADIDSALVISSIPEMTENCELSEITNEEQLQTALNSYNSGTNVLVMLKNDIFLTSSKLLQDSGSEITINGCGHSIYSVNNSYTPISYKGGMAYAQYNDSITGKEKFINENGKILNISRTSYYQAAGQITDEEGNTPSQDRPDHEASGVRRFLLPSELQSLNIQESDNVFINFSCWFVAYTSKVIKIENGYLYFQYQGGYVVNGDYNFGRKYTSFCLINYTVDPNSVTIKEGNIIFPSDNSIIYKCSNSNNFIITDNTGIVKFTNIIFKSGASSVPVINVLRSTAIIENCKFEGNVDYCIRCGIFDPSGVTPLWGAGSVYVNKCIFDNLGAGAVAAAEDTLCYVANCKILNCGQSRSNSYGVNSRGKYYICNNEFKDFGYSAISTGIPTMTEQHNCEGIIEKNIIHQSLEYFNEAENNVVMDAGAIYISTNHVNTIIRYNRIFNYKGRYANRGIYCDGGDYNIKVYSNVVNNTPNSISIDAYAPNSSYNTAGNTKNVNKVIAQNIVDGGILLQGNSDSSILDNECYLGHNLLVSGYCTIETKNVPHIENQIRNYSASLSNGTCSLFISNNPWGIN